MLKFCIICNKKLSRKTKGNLCVSHNNQTTEKREISRQGQLGRKHSEEQNKKVSLRMSGSLHPCYGKPMSAEKKLKLRLANLGRIHSEESKLKTSVKTKGSNNPMFGKKGANHPHWKGGSHLTWVRHNSARRVLGYDVLNEEFEGSEAHHIDTEHVVFIPKKLHRSVWHSQNKPDTMTKINTLVFCWLLGK